LSRRPSPRLLLLVVGLAACSGARPAPKPPIFPPVAAWKTLLGEAVVGPLAADGRRVFVATRDGAVRALDALTGSVLWKAEGFPGRLSARDGVLLVRDESGAVTSLHPRTGDVRWRCHTGVGGALPALVDGDHVLVAGRGVASLRLETGALVWVDGAGAETTAPPAATTARLVTGEKDGTLRCRDRASGSSLWTLRTREALLAPPLVDEARQRLYLGTTDRRILEVSLDKGRPGWSWRVGADVAHAGLLLRGRVLFAPYDAVLYALATGGNLAWRSVLPSRPAGAPLAVDGHVLVACLENQVVAFDAATGAPAGSFKTPAEIRTPPIRAAGFLVLGMRDRSVIAYGPSSAAAPAAEPVELTIREQDLVDLMNRPG
jgi:outer membrane protein assembly factor BamB